MTLRKLSLALTLAAVVALPLAASQAIPRNSDGSTPTGLQTQAHMIYRALLGRDADTAGLNDTALDIQRGRTRQRVDAIVSGTEFRGKVAGRTPEQMLTQIYQGLLQRDPDPGSAGWLSMIQRQQYSNAVMGIMDTDEFRSKLAAAASSTPSAPAGVTVDTNAAVGCQENIVEAIRNDLTGFVFIQFDQASISGSTISGSATDVSDGGRRLTYRCDGNSSYSYDDGRRARSAPASGEFSNEIVRSCQGEIRTKVQRTGAANVEFESAGLIPGDGVQWVRGLGFEKSASGANGANFHYTCEMKGTQILVSSFRGR